MAAPAQKAARLLAGLVPAAVEPLQGIPYASMAVVAMAFPAQDVDAGSGLLVPPVAGRLVKGVTVSSSKWSHLAGEALLVRASVGRFRGEAELQRSDDDLTAAVVADVADLLGLSRPEPLETRLVRWGGGLPQYLVGHPARVDAIRAAVSQVPGLAIAAPPSGESASPPASATPSTRSTPCSDPARVRISMPSRSPGVDMRTISGRGAPARVAGRRHGRSGRRCRGRARRTRLELVGQP